MEKKNEAWQVVSSKYLFRRPWLTVHLLTLDEVKQLLQNNEILQALHAAPLWKYIALVHEMSRPV